MDSATPPPTVWVRRNGEVHELPIGCPDSWPYSTVAAHRLMAGRAPGDDAPPMVLTNVLTGSTVTVSGSGTREDPMDCPELEGATLPPCTCEVSNMPSGADSPLAVANTFDGAGAPPGQDSSTAADTERAAAPRRLSTMHTVFLPGDEPGGLA